MNNALNIGDMPKAMPKGYLAKALRHARRVSHPGTHIFVISDFSDMDEEANRQMRLLSRHCQLMAVKVSDPMEQELPLPDSYTVTNGQHRQTVDTRRKKLREQFREQFQLNHQQLNDAMGQYRIPLLQLSTAENTGEQLLARFGVSRHRGN